MRSIPPRGESGNTTVMKRKKLRQAEALSEAEPAAVKRPKLLEDACAKFLSLAAESDSLVAGLTFFSSEAKGGGQSSQLLIGSYLSRHPDCEEVLAPLSWERSKQTHDVLLLCFQCLEQVLLYTASCDNRLKQPPPSTMDTRHLQSVGVKLTRTLLKEHLRPVYSSLVTTVPMRLVAACLRLLTAMVAQGSGSAREVQAVFNFAYKPLTVLPNRTHTIQGTPDSVRRCLMNFSLSFLVVGDSDTIKAILELKGFLSSMFKLLPKDPPETIHLFLSTILEKVVLNAAISKRTKSGFFTHFVFKQLAQLLHPHWTSSDNDHQQQQQQQQQQQEGGGASTASDNELRQFVFELLLKLCTDFQLGVCYKTKELPHGLEKTNNPVLLQLLLPLAGSVGDQLVQRLTVATIRTCPDLLLPYLKAITLTFDPQPGSKWMVIMTFLTELLSCLPNPASLLSPGCPSYSPSPSPQPRLSLLELGVWLTVPSIVTRSMLSLGVLHPLLEVKCKTFCLMEEILQRANSVVKAWGPVNRSLATLDSFLVAYCDRVLKCLPDMKTLITVRQQLVANPPPECSTDTPADIHVVPLLARVVTAMNCYQSLSPAIIVQSDFNLSKLLPTADLHGNLTGSCDPSLLWATPVLLNNAPRGSVQWQQQDGKHLRCLLWLALWEEDDDCIDSVSEAASDLIENLMESTVALSGFECELDLVLTTFVKFCEMLPDVKHRLVSFLAGALLAVDGEWLEYRGRVEAIIVAGEGEPGRSVGRREEEEDGLSLEDILAAPLEIPIPTIKPGTVEPGSTNAVAVKTTVVGQSNKAAAASRMCPLVPCLLLKLAELEPGPLLLYVGAVLSQLLLVQVSSRAVEECACVVLHYLTSPPLRDKYRTGSFRGLYVGLVNYFRSWTSNRLPKVELEPQLSDSKAQRKLKKLTASSVTPSEAVELMSTLGDDVVGCVDPAADLERLVILYLRTRPLHLVGAAGSPNIRCFPTYFTSVELLVQCVPTSPQGAGGGLCGTVSKLSGTCTLERNFGFLVHDSLSHPISLRCGIKSILTVLLGVYKYEADCGTYDFLRAIHFLFSLISSTIEESFENDALFVSQTRQSIKLCLLVIDSFSEVFLDDEDSLVPPTQPSRDHDAPHNAATSQAFMKEVGKLVCGCVKLHPNLCDSEQFKAFSAKVVCVTNALSLQADVHKQTADFVMEILELFQPYLHEDVASSLIEQLVINLEEEGDQTNVPFTIQALVHLTVPAEQVKDTLQTTAEEDSYCGSQNGRLKCMDMSRLAELAIRYKSTDLVRVTFQHSLWDYTRKPSSGTVGVRGPLEDLVRSLLTPTDKEGVVSEPPPSPPPLLLALPSGVPQKDGVGGAVLPASGSSHDPVLRDTLSQLASKLMKNEKRSNFSWLLGEYPDCESTEMEGAANDPFCLGSNIACELLGFCCESRNSTCIKLATPLMTDTPFGFLTFEQELLEPFCEHTASTCDSTCLQFLIKFIEIADISGNFRKNIMDVRRAMWEKCCSVLSEGTEPSRVQELCATLLKLITTHSKKSRKKLALRAVEEWNDGNLWTRYQVSLCAAVVSLTGDEGLAGLVLRKALQKLAHLLSECGETAAEEIDVLVKETCSVVEGVLGGNFDMDTEIWSNFIHSLLRTGCANAAALHLLSQLVPLLHSTPAPVGGGVAMVTLSTLYEMLWSHSEFTKFMCSSHDELPNEPPANTKGSLIELLVAVVELEPSVCKKQHVPVLLASYSATRSNSDRGILYLLYKYEESGVNLGEFRPFLWGAAALEQYKIKQEVGWLLWKQPGTVDVIGQLDREIMKLSYEDFPIESPLEPSNPYPTEAVGSCVYDPCFMLPLLSHLLDAGCVVDCRQFIDLGCLGYLIASLASKEEGVRRGGAHSLYRFRQHLKGARFKEKQQIVLLLQVLRNSLEEHGHLPSLFTAFFAKTAELFLHPEHPLYPVVSHFVIYKPAVSLSDIPLYYTLLHSSSAQHTQECRWMLDLLSKGHGESNRAANYLYRKNKVLSHVVVLYNYLSRL